MSNTLMIPVKLVGDVRESVRVLMGHAAEEILAALTQADHEIYPEWFLEPRKQLEDVWALIDQLGWATGDETGDVEIDLGRYGLLLKEVAESHLEGIEYEEENGDENDRTRIEKGDQPRKPEIVERLAAFREFLATLERVIEETTD